MSEKFDIEVDLNGWLVPMHVEQKGKDVFKVAYEDVTLGYLVHKEPSKWKYIHNIFTEGLLNARTAAMIGQAIKAY